MATNAGSFEAQGKISPAISTGALIPWVGYVLPALGYCMLYSGAALLFAFLLFEDRDLA